MIKIASTAAGGYEIEENLKRVVAELQVKLEGNPPDLGLVFLTSHFAESLPQFLKELQRALPVRILLGCTGEGVIGPQQEYENEPAVVVWMAHLPQVSLEPFYLSVEQAQKAGSREDWEYLLHTHASEKSHIILLGDPYSLPIDKVLNGVNQHLPNCKVVGGMASGALTAGESMLFIKDEIYHNGGIGVTISGPVEIETIISQGCRPIGQPLMITQGDRNVIAQLSGKPALVALNDVYAHLPEEDQELMDHGVFIGRVIDEYKQEFKRGDFLIRNVVGADQESGALAVIDRVSTGITIQFHVRDAATAEEDLRALLNQYNGDAPVGALFFNCNGRGSRMFSQANHELNILREHLNAPPTVGFFCAGELGPVCGQNFIHGHTASIALFWEKRKR